jgi:hypothetical protein
MCHVAPHQVGRIQSSIHRFVDQGGDTKLMMLYMVSSSVPYSIPCASNTCNLANFTLAMAITSSNVVSQEGLVACTIADRLLAAYSDMVALGLRH